MGRRSVFFKGGVIFIDKIDSVWYVLGGRPSYEGSHDGINAVNCRDVGIHLQRNVCLYTLKGDGRSLKDFNNPEKFIASFKVNILTLTGLNDWVHNTDELNKSHLTWSKKN